ncbi:hypothetical protein EV191_1011019 [Tamaricihabitans halophyticus]|uniref:DUF3137 domain-containing protein n=1 Tax=Tamaricihabitans halophyticus TaxID=1262583 RepID=A0A4R2R4X1_9PSEU|nr:DUF3137 domain-containing protein [Tamaricihabitans halophyticus]TCP57067.1 hypothetical protein EV191_1011019 [Tamaricihabitans halophyticus]
MVWALLVSTLFLLGLVGVLLAVRQLAKRSLRRRHQVAAMAIQQLVHYHGWRYAPVDPTLLARFAKGDPFDLALPNRRTAQHVVTGQYRGRWFCCFQFSYRQPQDTYGLKPLVHFKVWVIPTPAHRPELQVSRANSLAGLFRGGEQVELESTQFNESFTVLSASPRFAFDVLHPRMMQWLLADSRAQRIPFRFEGGELIGWELGALTGHEIEYGVNYLCDIADQVPDFVWRQY